ncbi:hypothetical protein MKW94_013694, partial [Papaver nudicaule]|nr:hypothetical protein [Papaver nudicaule]
MAPKRPRDLESNSNTNNDHEMSSSQSIHEIVKGSHVYEIKGYSIAKGMGVGKRMTSGKFTVGGYDWRILFYPDGYDQATEEYIGVVTYEFKLLDQSRKGKYGVHRRSRSTKTLTNQGNSWYVPYV